MTLQLLVAAFGLAILGLGLVGVVDPRRLIRWVAAIPPEKRIPIAVAVRVVMGAVCLLAAPATAYPTAVMAFGILALAAAAALPVLGPARLDALIDWWLARPDGFIRGWACFAAALGAGLVAAVLQAPGATG